MLITIYFWWRNIRGIHESSEDALRIMYVTTVMVVLMIVWSGFTILTHPEKQRLPPSPVPQNLSFDRDAVGWLLKIAPGALRETAPDPAAAADQPNTEPRYRMAPDAGTLLGLIGILMAFGHSILAMSGEETLAQVNRELEYPKHRNLMRAGLVIFIYSLLFTSPVSFFAYMIIPDHVRPRYFDNLISGIAMNLAGPWSLKLLFQAFVVVVGFLMLAGAVNTAIIGSNGVLNRVSEDGVLSDWFRAPHKKYGTTYRVINLIVLLQLVTIVFSRGRIYLLGEACAFGVIWSFAFKSLGVLVLRSPQSVGVRPGNALCLVRDYRTLDHLRVALEMIDTDKRDLVAATIRVSKGPHAGYEKISAHHLFTSYEQLLFSKVVALAEEVGKPVHLLVVPSSNVFVGSAHAAAQLESTEIIAGRSSAITPKNQAQRLKQAWETLPSKPEQQVRFLVIEPNRKVHEFYINSHQVKSQESGM